jgi:thermitase
MRVLLGDMNYAFVPQTDGPTKLFVFRTSREAATTFLRGAKESTNSADSKRIRNELIIKVKPGTDIEALARKIGAKITGRLDQIGVYRLEFTDEAAAEAARKTLSDNPEVEGIDVNYVIDPPAAPQTAPYQASGTPDLKLNPPNCDGKVVVGLIDTAIQPLGNGLDAFLLKSISVAGEANPTSASPTHATSMAVNILQGIQASGKNTAVQILPVNVYGANPTASTFDVAAGILAAVNNGANVINLSLGTPSDSAFLRSLIEAVTAKNIPVFAAAGNQPVATPTYPAAYSDVIAVTAGDKGQLASYANYGNFVDIIAPGTSFVNFNGQTWVVSGTSSASAFAAGRTAGLADSGCNSTFSAAQQVRSSMTFQSPVK